MIESAVHDEPRTAHVTPLTRASPGVVRLIAMGIIILATGLRGWAAAAGAFYWDDFVLQGRAARLPMSLSFLLYDHDGHFMPLGHLVSWLTERTTPFGYDLPVLTMVVLFAIWLVLMHVLLVELFGLRPLVLAPLALVAFAPLTLPSGIWWAAALNLLPLLIGITIAAIGHVRWLRTSRVKSAALAFCGVLLALVTMEKGIMAVVTMAGLTVVLRPEGETLWAAVRGSLMAHWKLWAAYGVLLSGYLVLFISRYTFKSPPKTDWSPAFDAAARAISHTLSVGLLGGPINWMSVGISVGIGDPPRWLIWLGLATTTTFVLAAVLLRKRARRMWLVVLLLLTLDIVGLAVGRVGPGFTSLIVQGFRYTADLSVVIALAFGFSLMPLAGDRETPTVTAIRSALASRPRASMLAVSVPLAFFIGCSVITTANFLDLWRVNPAMRWVNQASASLAAAPKDVPISDFSVPDFVLWRLSAPYSDASWLLAPVADRPPIESSSDKPQLITKEGQLTPATVTGWSTGLGPTPNCGWAMTKGQTTLPLPGTAINSTYTVRIGYLSEGPAKMSVQLGDAGTPVSFPLAAGLHDVYVRVRGEGDHLVFSDVPASNVCVGGATLGDLSPSGTPQVAAP